MGLRRYKSLYQAFLISGQIEESLNEGNADQAQIEAVQGREALHQFVLDGHWATGWRFTQMSDPCQKMRTAGKEIELEAALGAIRGEEDLRKRSRGILTEKAESDEDPDATKGPKAKAHAKKN